MAKKKKKKRKLKLPYRAFRIKRGKSYYYGYISNLTGRRISKHVKSKNKKLQGMREAYGVDFWVETLIKDPRTGSIIGKKRKKYKRTDKTLKKIRATISEYERMGFNPLDASPGYERLFVWHRKNQTRKAYEFFVRSEMGKRIAEKYLIEKPWAHGR